MRQRLDEGSSGGHRGAAEPGRGRRAAAARPRQWEDEGNGGGGPRCRSSSSSSWLPAWSPTARRGRGHFQLQLRPLAPFSTGAAGLAAMLAAGAALLVLVCAASLRCSTAPKKLLSGGVSIEEPRAGGGGEECDMFNPLYASRDCPFLDVGFRCSDNDRPDE
ncbi:hypothetical protein [Oryza sativa Japonica Group]|uniref:Uncharacterized protein n=3 Tax=Oryza sativa subsp. japonica TaxID=39947 RepID=Q8S0Q3_ORYSJ|nr:hypothetical protein [Oryza sativa Japonica Group]BAD82125.1 hypothetical protein [Oryza sativa Japonica Group]